LAGESYLFLLAAGFFFAAAFFFAGAFFFAVANSLTPFRVLPKRCSNYLQNKRSKKFSIHRGDLLTPLKKFLQSFLLRNHKPKFVSPLCKFERTLFEFHFTY